MSQRRPTMNQDGLTSMERVTMVLCPCKYMNIPSMETRDCCYCCHESSKSDLLNIPPYIEIGGTCLPPSNPINKYFVIFRFIEMLYIIYVTLFSFGIWVWKGDTVFWFMYFTEWISTIATMLSILRFISAFKLYKNKNNIIDKNNNLYDIDTNNNLWRMYKCQKILLQMALPSLSVLVVMYWLAVYTGRFSTIYDEISSYQKHGLSCIVIWIDFLISTERMYYKSFIWAILFSALYNIWCIIFEIFINVNQNDDTYIYTTTNWSESLSIPIIAACIGYIFLVVWSVLATFIKNIILIYSGVNTTISNYGNGATNSENYPLHDV